MTNITTTNTTLQANLDILNAFKAQVDEIGQKCLSIEIKDDDTLAIASQNLSKASQLNKSIEDKVKTIRKPYNDELKKIGVVGASLTEDLSKGIAHLKSGIADWETKRKEEEKRQEDALSYINGGLKTRLQALVDGCKTKEDCTAALEYIKNNFPKDEKFAGHTAIAHALRDQYIALITAASDGNLSAISEVKESIAEASNVALKAQEVAVATSGTGKVRGSRYSWTFECEDMSKVPQEWLMVDEEKVKAYMAANKDTLKEYEVVKGIKFFKKLTISA